MPSSAPRCTSPAIPHTPHSCPASPVLAQPCVSMLAETHFPRHHTQTLNLTCRTSGCACASCGVARLAHAR
eukprot:14069716-Alexandrium_andersonii.AAC.1